MILILHYSSMVTLQKLRNLLNQQNLNLQYYPLCLFLLKNLRLLLLKNLCLEYSQLNLLSQLLKNLSREYNQLNQPCLLLKNLSQEQNQLNPLSLLLKSLLQQIHLRQMIRIRNLLIPSLKIMQQIPYLQILRMKTQLQMSQPQLQMSQPQLRMSQPQLQMSPNLTEQLSQSLTITSQFNQIKSNHSKVRLRLWSSQTSTSMDII